MNQNILRVPVTVLQETGFSFKAFVASIDMINQTSYSWQVPFASMITCFNTKCARKSSTSSIFWS